MAAVRVLVVDDQTELASVVAGALEARGFEVRVAHSGEEALAAIAEGRPDVAVVDLLLPDMLGTQVLDALAREQPAVPSVAVSGVFHGERYRREAVETHGARRFLEKPFSTRSLVGLVAELVGQASLDEADLDEPLFKDGLPGDDPVEAALEALTEAAEPEVGSLPPQPAESFDPRGIVDELPDPRASDRARRMGIVEDLVAPRASSRPSPSASHRPASPSPDPERPGRLGPLVLPRLLTACRRRGLGGRLDLARHGLARSIHLDGGEVVFASSNVPGDRLLAFAVREGRLSTGDAREVEACMREGRRVGEAVLSLGLVDRPGLRRLVADHAAAIVRAALCWTDGTYRLQEAPVRTRVVEQPLPRLLRAGLKEAPIQAVVAALADEARPRPHPDPAFDPADPEVLGEAADLLMAADGTKTVADLLALTDLPAREARARLAAWVGLEVLTLSGGAPARKVAFVL